VQHEYSYDPCLLLTFAKREDAARFKENINGAVYLCSGFCQKTGKLQSHVEQGCFKLLFLSVPAPLHANKLKGHVALETSHIMVGYNLICLMAFCQLQLLLNSRMLQENDQVR
jgi:hypothetical protein